MTHRIILSLLAIFNSRKNTRHSYLWFPLLLVYLLFATAGCTASSDSTVTRIDPVMEEPLPDAITATSEDKETDRFPTELARTFDRTLCPSHCWHDLALGQTVEEAITAIRHDPTTDREAVFMDAYEIARDDYLIIEEHNNGATTVAWQIKDLRPTELPRWHTLADLFATDQIVDSLLIPLQEPFSLYVLIDELGPPDYLSFVGLQGSRALPVVTYVDERAAFFLQVSGDDYELRETTMVETVVFYGEETIREVLCIEGYYSQWAGLGHLGMYGSPELLVEGMPLECITP
jgi:hypothetical protein